MKKLSTSKSPSNQQIPHQPQQQQQQPQPSMGIVCSGSTSPNGKDLVHQEELDKQINRLNSTETATKKVHKEAKKLSDVLLANNRFDCKLTNDLSNSVLCQQHETELRMLVEDWHSYNSETAHHGEDFVLNLQKTIVDPLKKFQGAYSEVKVAIKKRDQLHQECQKFTAKIAKFKEKEKTAQNIVKIDQAKNAQTSAEEDFQQQNDLLLHELPLFLDSRVGRLTSVYFTFS